MSDMFGAPVGMVHYDEDLLNTLKGATGIEHTMGQIAMQPTEMRLKTAQAGGAELDLQNKQKMQEIMSRYAQGQGTGGPGGAASGGERGFIGRIDDMAELAAGAGLFDQAQKLALGAANLRLKGAQTGAAMSNAQLRQLKGIATQAELQGQTFGGVKNEEEWNKANELWQFRTGQPSPFADIPYSEDLVKGINESALTTKERVAAEEKRLSRENKDRHDKVREGQIDLQNTIRKQREELAEKREERLAKAGGGKTVSSPTVTEINQVKNLIKRDFENLESADVRDAAFNIAAEAKALRRQNPVLDASTALSQAYANAKQAGDFQTLDRIGSSLRGMQQKYQGQGKTPQTALSVPKDAKGAVKGRYYLSPSGIVGQWNGEKFVVVPGGGATLSGDNGGTESDNPDADDDDGEED